MKRDPEELINQIIRVFNREDEIVSSGAYGDGGTDPLFPRLGRAALDQACKDGATIIRYAIWANTVRDNILQAIELLDKFEMREANRYLVRAANSLSAFAEIQALFDTSKTGKCRHRRKKNVDG